MFSWLWQNSIIHKSLKQFSSICLYHICKYTVGWWQGTWLFLKLIDGAIKLHDKGHIQRKRSKSQDHWIHLQGTGFSFAVYNTQYTNFSTSFPLLSAGGVDLPKGGGKSSAISNQEGREGVVVLSMYHQRDLAGWPVSSTVLHPAERDIGARAQDDTEAGPETDDTDPAPSPQV